MKHPSVQLIPLHIVLYNYDDKLQQVALASILKSDIKVRIDGDSDDNEISCGDEYERPIFRIILTSFIYHRLQVNC
jgi:hypothetical protein